MMMKTWLIALLVALSSSAFPVHAANPSAAGDVVGRDLNYAVIGWLGHVGMWTGSSVLEVLNEPTVIHTNTLTNFKNRTRYWGARY